MGCGSDLLDRDKRDAPVIVLEEDVETREEIHPTKKIGRMLGFQKMATYWKDFRTQSNSNGVNRHNTYPSEEQTLIPRVGYGREEEFSS